MSAARIFSKMALAYLSIGVLLLTCFPQAESATYVCDKLGAEVDLCLEPSGDR